MTTKTFAVSAGGDPLAIGELVVGGTVGSVLFIGAGGLLAEDNPNFFWDDTNDRLGIGYSTPQNKIHVDEGTASASYLQFTAGATTGQGATDGMWFGISALGDGEIRQRENLDVNVFTNDINTARFRANGRLTIGAMSEAYGNNVNDDTLFLVNGLVTTIGDSLAPFNILKLVSQSGIRVEPSADTNSGVGVTLYAGQGSTLTLAGSTNLYNGGMPIGNFGIPISGVGGFGTVGYQGTSPNTLDGAIGTFFTVTHGGYGGDADYLIGAAFNSETADEPALGTPTGVMNNLIGGLFKCSASGVDVGAAVSGRFEEPEAFDGFTGAPIPTIFSRTACWINGTMSVSLSTVASAASIVDMAVDSSYVRLTGSTATTLDGIHADDFPKTFWLYNATGQNLTIAHQSGTEPTAANRIITMTGANIVTTADGAAFFQYDLLLARWICLFTTA